MRTYKLRDEVWGELHLAQSRKAGAFEGDMGKGAEEVLARAWIEQADERSRVGAAEVGLAR